MKKLRFWLIFAALGAAVSGGAYYFAQIYETSGSASTATPKTAEGGKSPSRAVAVEAARVRIDTVVDDLQAVGTLHPNEAVIVAPEVAGRIERIEGNAPA